MGLDAVLIEVHSWPMEERFRLNEAVWDRLADEGAATELTEDVKSLLDRRIAALERDSAAVIPWEVVEARAFERFLRGACASS